MDTLPAQLDEVAATHGSLDDFRITSEAEIFEIVKTLATDSVMVNLNASDGTAYGSTIWAIDAERGMLSFSVDPNSAQMQSLVEAEEAVAVAYLDNIKLQFDASGLMLVHGENFSALSCMLPKEIYRFQRRGGFRVQPLLRNTPVARVRHPMIPDMNLSLRVLDVSIGGCALFLPDDVPPMQPGVVLNGVQLELDIDTRVSPSLRLQHVTSLNHEAKGVRLGLEIVNPTADVLRSLQRYIDQTQKRLRAMRR